MPSSSIYLVNIPLLSGNKHKIRQALFKKANYVSMPLMFPGNYLALLDFWQAGETTELQLKYVMRHNPWR